jgi:surface antigen
MSNIGNNLLTKLVLLLVSISLVACSSNTQKQNTGIGVATGAVVGGVVGGVAGAGKAVAIGAGVLIGALIGGVVGRSVESSDRTKMNSAMNNPTNQPSYWRNSHTGATYRVTPRSNLITINGNPNCRKYETIGTIDSTRQRIHGVACRQSNGSWQAIRT